MALKRKEGGGEGRRVSSPSSPASFSASRCIGGTRGFGKEFVDGNRLNGESMEEEEKGQKNESGRGIDPS